MLILDGGIDKLGLAQLLISLCSTMQEFDSMKSPADRGRINSDEFVTMFQEMATRPEIYFLLIRFANRDYFTADDFLHFLECEQAVTLSWFSFDFQAASPLFEKLLSRIS